MLDKFNHFLHKSYITFINIIHVLTIPIIISLAIASGFTTLMGMRLYINYWIALIITIAVQIIIILSAFQLSNTYFQAHKIRFIGLV